MDGWTVAGIVVGAVVGICWRLRGRRTGIIVFGVGSAAVCAMWLAAKYAWGGFTICQPR